MDLANFSLILGIITSAVCGFVGYKNGFKNGYHHYAREVWEKDDRNRKKWS
jgi:hypothetical protein